MSVLEVLGQPAERRRNEWRYGRHGSLVVNVAGQRVGSWHDFEADGGGGLDLLRHYEGLDKPEALEWLRAISDNYFCRLTTTRIAGFA